MRVVIAPDKFAGTLTASEAAAAIARGWARARPCDELHMLPMADGGEGLLDVVSAAVEASRRHVRVTGPIGTGVDAAWLLLHDGRAVIEAAEAIGLRLVPPHLRDPLRATSSGLGQLLAAAASSGCREIVVGLGGSATVDCGAGAALALGAVLEDDSGNRLPGVPLSLRHSARLDGLRAALPPVTAAVDVNNPLLGMKGAARMFGGQKGATPHDIDLLEEALRTFAGVAERDLNGGPWRDAPGAGAAGGLGFALMAFTGARVSPGAAVVADLIGLRGAVAAADAVVTGEGSLDAQTLHGKAPDHVRRLARGCGVPVAAIAGRVEFQAAARFGAVRELGPEGLVRAQALTEDAAADLARSVHRWGRNSSSGPA